MERNKLILFFLLIISISGATFAREIGGLMAAEEISAKEIEKIKNIVKMKDVKEVKGTKETEKAIGWHWYNEIYPEDREDKKDKNINKGERKKSAMFQMGLLRQAVQEAKAKAILYPTEENMRIYLILQNFVVGKAALFTKMWKRTLLDYPELDYGILHPAQNSARHLLYAEIRKREDGAIKTFGKKYGLLFFYRGSNSLDQALAPTIESFSKDNNISLIPVSVDGVKAAAFAVSHDDNGQAEKLGVKHFPALILVDPKNQRVQPLNYGFVSETELRRRFLQIATNFQDGA